MKTNSTNGFHNLPPPSPEAVAEVVRLEEKGKTLRRERKRLLEVMADVEAAADERNKKQKQKRIAAAEKVLAEAAVEKRTGIISRLLSSLKFPDESAAVLEADVAEEGQRRLDALDRALQQNKNDLALAQQKLLRERLIMGAKKATDVMKEICPLLIDIDRSRWQLMHSKHDSLLRPLPHVLIDTTARSAIEQLGREQSWIVSHECERVESEELFKALKERGAK